MDQSNGERLPPMPERLFRIYEVEGIFDDVAERDSFREVAEYLMSLEERIEQLEKEIRRLRD